MNINITIKTDEKRLRPQNSEVNRLWADNTKAKKIFDWSPSYGDKPGFERGLAETINWMKDPENIKSYKKDIYNI